MAAEVKTGNYASNDRFAVSNKPILLTKLNGFSADVNGVALLGDEDGLITVSDDKSIRVWLKRDSGQYWPSVHYLLPSGVSCMHFMPETKVVFVGQDNGTVTELKLSADCNQLNFVRDYLSHKARVTAVHYSAQNQWVLSVSRDRMLAQYCTRTGNKISELLLDAWCSTLAFEDQTKHAFVGDYSGQITLLRYTNGTAAASGTASASNSMHDISAGGVGSGGPGASGIQVLTTMKGHQSVIGALEWFNDRQFLFSASYDHMIIIWDIGSRKGLSYELQGHQNKVTALRYLKDSKRLLSVGEDGAMIFWNIEVERKVSPAWVESDSCQLCAKPFFWNIKGMLDYKQFGSRQHHCRHCGKAVCERCSAMALTIPAMGFELPVRVCEKCAKLLQNVDRPSLATFHDCKHRVVTMCVDEQKKRMVTAGLDHVIKVWDISDVLDN